MIDITVDDFDCENDVINFLAFFLKYKCRFCFKIITCTPCTCFIKDFFADALQSIPDDLMTANTSTPIKNSNKFGNCSVNISFNDCNVLQQDSFKSLSSSTEMNSANAYKIQENFGISEFVAKKNNLSSNCTELENESNEKTLLINKRFIPGFTPKAKKRKFPGPAGLLSEEIKESGKQVFGTSDTNRNNQMLSNSEKELENIIISILSRRITASFMENTANRSFFVP
ncbi:uncharacterized protein LOC118202840 isoform X1 [Stegodyphus dumicola]|uniref:uncharacterized protein LOC118202840 isoform X1 n=1 Tax=Stegodyphus dumicola TaxID=202533 RepID=UPI0015A7F1A9|nr:uncharacterized protein LOC118202840 isoform X1 [Stegodyphus dumicola]